VSPLTAADQISRQEQYFNYLDRRDFTSLADVFCESATAVYDFHGPTPLVGRQAIVEALAVVKSFASTLHTRSNSALTPDGVTWTTFATALLIQRDGELILRGLRYDDEWTRECDQLRIHHRLQRCLWEARGPKAQEAAMKFEHRNGPDG